MDIIVDLEPLLAENQCWLDMTESELTDFCYSLFISTEPTEQLDWYIAESASGYISTAAEITPGLYDLLIRANAIMDKAFVSRIIAIEDLTVEDRVLYLEYANY